MPVWILNKQPLFPPASEAEPDGLLAIGGDFSAKRLLNAYSSGIFPWFEEGNDIYWFSPDPRLVLFPQKLKVSSSLEREIRKNRFEVRFDQDFRGVMEQCAKVPRKHEPGTWISERFIKGYTRLHRLGFAHSVESYYNGNLAGGLYGISIGGAFFGESMFHLMPNASKTAFVYLVRHLQAWGFRLIDCQMETSHLKQFGAEVISRKHFLVLLSEALKMNPSLSENKNWDLPTPPV